MSKRDILTFLLGVGVTLAALLTATAGAWAQNYPTRIIRVINPAAAGGNSDLLFRVLSPKMVELLGELRLSTSKRGDLDFPLPKPYAGFLRGFAVGV